ncbi:esterase-like activity of phytase family protein [Rubrimonas cliftonensis]|uniref:VPLPA-CTERM protein sorting domain-containing protein n=1 Tax=Rubrimonas cliftonensis TaxID=89524 RepID=A0A1H4A2N3_9RHOB|nr:esterase-like activity of phytase family protein [Rubrimonas cliftonensis]SEA30403.1 VPLPA-CTERM protein sorting domain-containing protein [Rubrimonas cliftonensis]
MIKTFTAVSLALVAAPLSAATLTGFASLPAETFVPGPTSGQFQNPANGVTPPYVGQQPVQGFSSVISNGAGGFLAMSDNGFGGKGNSADALLLVHDISVDFRTETGGTGAVTVNSSTPLSDPDDLVSFPIVAEQTFYPNGAGDIPVDGAIASGRLLTGADFDIESIRRDASGNFWIGEEFGPFLLHTNADFELIAPEIATPGVQSPNNPFLGAAAPNLGGSRGYEGMAINEAGDTLYTLLEGTVAGDPARTLRLSEFDIADASFTGEQWLYPLDPAGAAIGELTLVEDNVFVVIERDGGQGPSAAFKKLFLIDLDQSDADGFLKKTEIVDLLAIDDPFDLDGDGSNVFSFPFVTIESVLPLDAYTLLVANDNNFPGSAGRTAGVPDNNEFIRITLDQPIASLAPVPLPAAGWLMIAGLAGLAAMRRRG